MAPETRPGPPEPSIPLPPALRTSRRTLPGGFAAVIFLFILINTLAAASVYVALGGKGVQAKTRDIVSNMLTGVELVARVQRDVNRERHLIDMHIFEKRTEGMSGLEARIADVEADLAATSTALESRLQKPDEVAVWSALDALVAAQQPEMQEVLELSRVNRDAEAHRAMLALEDRFDVISGRIAQLTELKHEQAARAVSEVAAVQLSAVEFIGAITVVGIVLSILLATAVTRLLSRRDQEILRAYVLVEQRNRELDAFAGRVAHDLRGPLNAIALADTTRRQSAPQEEHTSAVIRRGVARMEGIIQDLLALSRSGVAMLGQCDPAPVAQLVREELSPHLGGDIGEVHVEVEHARVGCTDGLLRQALWNLADNAVKYRRPGVLLDLEIRGHVVGGSYELQVTDNGMGMTAEEARRAFEPFFRADAAHEKVGSGLGLSIVKRIVEAVGGSVSVASEVARGTTFDIHLPLAGAR